MTVSVKISDRSCGGGKSHDYKQSQADNGRKESFNQDYGLRHWSLKYDHPSGKAEWDKPVPDLHPGDNS